MALSQTDWNAYVAAVAALDNKPDLYAEDVAAMLEWTKELYAANPDVPVFAEKIGDWSYLLGTGTLPSMGGGGNGGGGGGNTGVYLPPAVGAGLLSGNTPLLIGAAVLAWFFLRK